MVKNMTLLETVLLYKLRQLTYLSSLAHNLLAHVIYKIHSNFLEDEMEQSLYEESLKNNENINHICMYFSTTIKSTFCFYLHFVLLRKILKKQGK